VKAKRWNPSSKFLRSRCHHPKKKNVGSSGKNANNVGHVDREHHKYDSRCKESTKLKPPVTLITERKAPKLLCDLPSSLTKYEPPVLVAGANGAWADMDSDEEMDFSKPCFEDDVDFEALCEMKTAGEGDSDLTECRARAVDVVSPSDSVLVDNTCLHNNIVAHTHAVSTQIRSQHRVRTKAVAAIQATVHSIWPQGRVCVYGSMYGDSNYSQLALPTSDMDIVVCNLFPRAPGCTDTVILEKLKDALRKMHGNDIAQSKIAQAASHSVLRLLKGQIPIDITVADAAHRGLASAEFVQLACERLPLLRPIVLVVKRLLHQHGLSNPLTGGLSGYSVVLLTVRYLLDREAQNPELQDLGVLLCDMLRFYGECFSAHTMGVRVRPGESYIFCSTESCPWACQPLFIEDPVNRANNVGVTAWAFPGVQKLFADASKVLRNSGSLGNLWKWSDSPAYQTLDFHAAFQPSLQ